MKSESVSSFGTKDDFSVFLLHLAVERLPGREGETGEKTTRERERERAAEKFRERERERTSERERKRD